MYFTECENGNQVAHFSFCWKCSLWLAGLICAVHPTAGTTGCMNAAMGNGRTINFWYDMIRSHLMHAKLMRHTVRGLMRPVALISSHRVDWNCRTGQWRTGHWRTDTSTVKSQTIKSMSPLHVSNSTQNSTNCPKLVIIHIMKRHSFIVLYSLQSLYPIVYAYMNMRITMVMLLRHTGHVSITTTRFAQLSQKRACPQDTSANPSRGATKHTSHVMNNTRYRTWPDRTWLLTRLWC